MILQRWCACEAHPHTADPATVLHPALKSSACWAAVLRWKQHTAPPPLAKGCGCTRALLPPPDGASPFDSKLRMLQGMPGLPAATLLAAVAASIDARGRAALTMTADTRTSATTEPGPQQPCLAAAAHHMHFSRSPRPAHRGRAAATPPTVLSKRQNHCGTARFTARARVGPFLAQQHTTEAHFVRSAGCSIPLLYAHLHLRICKG